MYIAPLSTRPSP